MSERSAGAFSLVAVLSAARCTSADSWLASCSSPAAPASDSMRRTCAAAAQETLSAPATTADLKVKVALISPPAGYYSACPVVAKLIEPHQQCQNLRNRY